MTTDEELQTAINKLKKGKASDNNGIRAEDIRTCVSKKAALAKHGAEYG